MGIMIESELIPMFERNVFIKANGASISYPAIVYQSSVVISFLLLFTLSFESVPLPVKAQIIPLTSILALLFLPFTITRVSVTPLLKVVTLFVAFVLLHSVVALFIDMAVLGAGEIRVIAWARQVIALIVGLSVFLVLRKTLVNVSDRFIIRAIIAGALPALVLALLNVLWGLTGSAVAEKIVVTVRTMLIPLGWTHPSRASGLSLEPSTFAIYLAVVVIPVIFAMFLQYPRSRKLAGCILAITMVAFAYTFSFVGWTVLFLMSIVGILLGPRRGIFAAVLLFGLIALLIITRLFPDNYMVMQISYLVGGSPTVSFIDRFYSTFGPFMTAFTSYTVLGYGLGGTATHFSDIMPEVAQEYIASVRWEGMPALSTLVGRLFAETGIIGLALFGSIIFIGLLELKMVGGSQNPGMKRGLFQIGKIALIGALIAYTVGHGSFALPYLWFWLAFIDSRYMLHRKEVNYNAET